MISLKAELKHVHTVILIIFAGCTEVAATYSFCFKCSKMFGTKELAMGGTYFSYLLAYRWQSPHLLIEEMELLPPKYFLNPVHNHQ